jgi:hypothetical protein
VVPPQGIRVSDVSDGEGGQGSEAIRDLVHLASPIGQDASHLVNRQAAVGGLQAQVGAGGSEVVYLRDLLTRLPTLTDWQIKDVTPQAWAKAKMVPGLKVA